MLKSERVGYIHLLSIIMKTKKSIAKDLGVNIDEIQDVLSIESLETMGMLAIRGGYSYDDDDGESDGEGKKDKCNKCEKCGGC